MRNAHCHTPRVQCIIMRSAGLRAGMILLAGLFLSAAVMSDNNNGPWTPEQSKTADHTPGTPTSPQGWYPPVQSDKPADSGSSNTPPPAPAPAPAPAPVPSHYNNGPWTPEQSKTADHTPGTPSSPRGWYPPVDGSPDKPANVGEDLSNFAEKIATSKLANPLIQGGKAIGRTYEAADRGDMTGTMIEATDGVGRLSAIGLGATEGATLGSAFGPLGTLVGGAIGGFIGNAGWEYTGGAINESSRQMHDQARQQADQARQAAPPRPAGGGSGGGGGGCTCR